MAASWVLQIGATAEGARDVANFIGFAADAQNTWDRRDLPEPLPPPGSHLKLYMPHADWPLYPDAYTADFRPPAPTAEWDFVVESNEETEAQLSFNSTGALPPDRTAHLLDLDRRVAVELQEISTYSVVLNAWEHRRFRVVVGTSDQSDDLTASFQALPSAYILEQNHPNPFNAETLIPYRLAERGPVRLIVYDLLGRQLVVLVDQIQNQGHHSLKWDGANEADHNTASGIYFYTLETPAGRLTRKMVLLR